MIKVLCRYPSNQVSPILFTVEETNRILFEPRLFTGIRPQLHAACFIQAATSISGELSITCFTVTHSRCSSLSKDFKWEYHVPNHSVCPQTSESELAHAKDLYHCSGLPCVMRCYVGVFSLTLAHVQMRKCSMNYRLFHYTVESGQPFKWCIPGEISVLSENSL